MAALWLDSIYCHHSSSDVVVHTTAAAMNIDGVIPFDLNTALLVVITSEPFHCCWQIDFVFEVRTPLAMTVLDSTLTEITTILFHKNNIFINNVAGVTLLVSVCVGKFCEIVCISLQQKEITWKIYPQNTFGNCIMSARYVVSFGISKCLHVSFIFFLMCACSREREMGSRERNREKLFYTRM